MSSSGWMVAKDFLWYFSPLLSKCLSWAGEYWEDKLLYFQRIYSVTHANHMTKRRKGTKCPRVEPTSVACVCIHVSARTFVDSCIFLWTTVLSRCSEPGPRWTSWRGLLWQRWAGRYAYFSLSGRQRCCVPGGGGGGGGGGEEGVSLIAETGLPANLSWDKSRSIPQLSSSTSLTPLLLNHRDVHQTPLHTALSFHCSKPGFKNPLVVIIGFLGDDNMIFSHL